MTEMIRFEDKPGEEVTLAGRDENIVYRKNALLGYTEGGAEIRGTTHSGLVNTSQALPYVRLVLPHTELIDG